MIYYPLGVIAKCPKNGVRHFTPKPFGKKALIAKQSYPPPNTSLHLPKKKSFTQGGIFLP